MVATREVPANNKRSAAARVNDTGPIELRLVVSDPNLCLELSRRQEPERARFALEAMRIGTIAIRQAQGVIDSYQVRNAGETVIRDMNEALEKHRRDTAQQVSDCIKQYFDPGSGLFSQRVRKLVGQRDEAGELENIIRHQIDGDDSPLAKTLAAHVGRGSGLMKALDPASADGLVATLVQEIETTLSEQRERIVGEFSLDNRESALSRLASELQRNHGDVGRALEERINSVTGEFSLDREDSALSRLVGRVETANRQISSQFSLDNEGSALARMRKEFLGVIEEQHRSNAEFQREVLKTLTDMTARKEEAQKGTRHGLVFEDAVAGFVSARQSEGDTVARTGNTTGLTRNCKKGDVVIQLGPETAAPGARIVVEAKEDQSYTLHKALAEMAEARRNRDAGVGAFVFSKRTAPEEIIEPLARYGNDIVVVWDAEDSASDAYLVAALSVAKALSVRDAGDNRPAGVDLEGLEKAIREIERQAGGLDEITKSAQAIDSHVNKILDRARIVRNGLEREVGVLNEQVDGLRKLSLSP